MVVPQHAAARHRAACHARQDPLTRSVLLGHHDVGRPEHGGGGARAAELCMGQRHQFFGYCRNVPR
jgi:hypothetical protein